jgi:hypothetical protein
VGESTVDTGNRRVGSLAVAAEAVGVCSGGCLWCAAATRERRRGGRVEEEERNKTEKIVGVREEAANEK